jgi:beta-galactosidase
MFFFGVDYYPEHWPEERWSEDALLMAEAGFNVVRLGEFAWAKLESSENCFHFDWLDRAIEKLSDHGIQVVLGTPTASAPPWVMESAPGLFRVRDDGQQVTYGNRRSYCPNHPVYRKHACRIVAALAEHYCEHPAVIGWQIDNEFGERCYCPICLDHFRAWLQNRYRNLDQLNAAWGTVFWSHIYTSWDQIPAPLLTGGSPNPGLALDFSRFSSDAYTDFQAAQARILRETCPRHFITHNFMGFGYDQVNAYNLARDLDLVSWDNYPRSQWTGSMVEVLDPLEQSLSHAAMRGLKRQNFWVIEQQAGPAGWEKIGPSPRPGELRLWAYQSIAHGADGILFFRWRTSCFGTEQFWHGLLNHDGYPSRRYQEVACMGREFLQIGDLISGSAFSSQIAMLLSYDSRFAFQLQTNNPGFSYGEHFKSIYRAFSQTGLGVDVVAPDSDLSSYHLVVAPALYVLNRPVVDNLKKYVREGGVLLLTVRSGVKDDANAVFDAPLPGPLADLIGAVVEDYDSLPQDCRPHVEFVRPELGNFETGVWCDVLRPGTAVAIAHYSSGWLAGKVAVTENEFGTGRVIYSGVYGDSRFYSALAGYLLRAQPSLFGEGQHKGLEVAIRTQGSRCFVFLLNHSTQPLAVTIPKDFFVLLGPRTTHGLLHIPPLDVWILTTEKPG